MTIIRRGSRYGVKVWDAGRRGYRWVGTFETEREAQRAERDAMLRPGRDRLSIEDWARIWLSDYSRPAPATRVTYRAAVKRIVADLGARDLDGVVRPEARSLAARWPRGVTRVARTMWADAVRDGIAGSNPWTNLRLETPRGRKDLDALTESEVRALAALAEIAHDSYGQEAAAVVLVLGFVGVRPGELCALRCADVDRAGREMTVRWSLDSTGQEKLPKNGKPRIVTVPPPALDAITQLPESLDGYLFHTRRGRRLSKGTLHYLWRPVVSAWRAQGGRDIDLYDLRHAAATHFLERGATPADVAVQLGHTDGGRLVQVLYGHPSEDRARDRLKMAYAERSQLGLRSGRGAGGFGA
ncbi:MAG: tyrosine-type recombinase/integrase [Acidiferrobacteraceae bacterium]